MRTHTLITFSLTALLISACDAPEQNGGEARMQPESTQEQATSTPTREPTLMEKTQEAGVEAWDKTKQVTSQALEQVGEAGQELYEVARDQVIEMGEAIGETSSEVYESAKDTTEETYESAKEEGAELIQDATQPAKQP